MEAHVEVLEISTCEVCTSRDNVSRYRVVDIEESSWLLCCALSHELRESTVEVNLTCYRNTTACEA